MRTSIRSAREKLHFLFEDVDTVAGRTLDLVVIFLVCVVSGIFVLKTYNFPPKILKTLNSIENGIVIIFMIEYAARLWAAPERLREAFKLYTMVDLIAIIPFFFANDSYQVLRIFRALRVLRLTRFLREKQSLLGRFSQIQLIVMRIIFIIFAIVFVSSGMIFYAESGKTGSHIHSFFDAVYFSIITLSTVGYGDITPVTGYGRFITVLIVSSGIIFIPWEIRQLMRQFRLSDEKVFRHCPFCGLAYHDNDAYFCKKCGSELDSEASLNIKDIKNE